MTWITRRFVVRSLPAAGITVWLAAASASYGQTGGTGGSTGGTGGSGISSSSLGVNGTGSGGGSSSGGASTSSTTPLRASTGGAGGAGGAGGVGGSTVDASNFLSPTFSNPLYEGRPNQTLSSGTASGTGTGSGTTSNASQPGGFGVSSFGNTTSNSNTRGSSAGSSLSSSSSTGTSAARVTYSTVVKFPTRPLAAGQLNADLRQILDRSTSIKNAAGVNVVVDNRTVVLRGQVVSDDERRLIEGMIRLTPGVRNVVNELVVRE